MRKESNSKLKIWNFKNGSFFEKKPWALNERFTYEVNNNDANNHNDDNDENDRINTRNDVNRPVILVENFNIQDVFFC